MARPGYRQWRRLILLTKALGLPLMRSAIPLKRVSLERPGYRLLLRFDLPRLGNSRLRTLRVGAALPRGQCRKPMV